MFMCDYTTHIIYYNIYIFLTSQKWREIVLALNFIFYYFQVYFITSYIISIYIHFIFANEREYGLGT